MQTVDLEMEQGATFRVSLTYEDSAGNPISLVGYRAHMQVRRRAGSRSPVLINLTSDTGGGIVLDGLTGNVHVRAGADQTALVAKDAVYDLHLISQADPTEVVRVFGGKIALTKAVTIE